MRCSWLEKSFKETQCPDFALILKEKHALIYKLQHVAAQF